MKSILTDLYYGRISPFERTRPVSPEYIALNREINDTLERFKSVLTEKDYKLFEEFEKKHNSLYESAIVDAFMQGFRLGTLVMTEVFAENIDIVKSNDIKGCTDAELLQKKPDTTNLTNILREIVSGIESPASPD